MSTANNVELISFANNDEGGGVDFKLRCTNCDEVFTMTIASEEADDFKEMIEGADKIFCCEDCEKEYEKSTAVASGVSEANSDTNAKSADAISKAIGN